MKRTLATCLGGIALTLVGAGPASADSIVNVGMLGAGNGRVAETTMKGGIDCPGQCSVDYVRYFDSRDHLLVLQRVGRRLLGNAANL